MASNISQTFSQDSSSDINVGNINGVVSLPTGAATSANQATEITALTSIESTSNSTAVNTNAVMANQTNGTQRTLVTDLVGNLQPSGDAPARTIYVKLNDGTNSVTLFNNQLAVEDILNTSAQYRAQSVTTTAALALGSTSALANRKMLHFTPTNGTIYWGYSSAVTSTSGTPVFTNQTVYLSVGPNVTVYVISAGTVDVRIAELS